MDLEEEGAPSGGDTQGRSANVGAATPPPTKPFAYAPTVFTSGSASYYGENLPADKSMFIVCGTTNDRAYIENTDWFQTKSLCGMHMEMNFKENEDEHADSQAVENVEVFMRSLVGCNAQTVTVVVSMDTPAQNTRNDIVFIGRPEDAAMERVAQMVLDCIHREEEIPWAQEMLAHQQHVLAFCCAGGCKKLRVFRDERPEKEYTYVLNPRTNELRAFIMKPGEETVCAENALALPVEVVHAAHGARRNVPYVDMNDDRHGYFRKDYRWPVRVPFQMHRYPRMAVVLASPECMRDVLCEQRPDDTLPWKELRWWCEHAVAAYRDRAAQYHKYAREMREEYMEMLHKHNEKIRVAEEKKQHVIQRNAVSAMMEFQNATPPPPLVPPKYGYQRAFQDECATSYAMLLKHGEAAWVWEDVMAGHNTSNV